ncbi:conserved hypothetical protein [Verrucomicrobiia bacterium DG1235]|nr:conserved hypothetical protein [Verrucomicrobiae bacterium DG1235]
MRLMLAVSSFLPFRKVFAVIFSSLAVGLGGVESESERLDSFFSRTYQEDLSRSPMSQTYRGIKTDYDKWNDISEAASLEDYEIDLVRKEELAGFDRAKLSEAEKLRLRLFELKLDLSLDAYPFRHHAYVMHQFRGWHTRVPAFLINAHRIDTVQDAEAYIDRLEGVKPLMRQVVAQLKIREKKGIFPPRWSYSQMIETSRNVLKGTPFEESEKASTLLADFGMKVAKLELGEAEETRLLANAETALLQSVAMGFEELIQELEHQQAIAPELDGVWKLPDGAAYYRNRLKYYTSTSMSAEEIHSLGLKHVKRIHSEMTSIMEVVGFEGDLQAFFEFMRTDPQFYYEDTDEGRKAYLDRATALIDTMRERLPEVFGMLPKADIEVKRVEAFRERSAGKAFYQRPAGDGSRPGRYYANLFDMNAMPTYQMEALAYHEGIPGHHMQRAIQTELKGVPDFQRYIGSVAYTEGWGLYSEYLPKEMGFYEDPYSDFGRLSMELWRACRLVVDTGLHAKKWTREQAIEYLVENTPNPELDAVKAIERYIVYPGQATAYMIGMLKILELREWAKGELGDAFDLAAFHDEVLKDGPVTLFVLEEKIRNWVEAARA